MGRPSSYGIEIANTICDRLAAGETLRGICRDDAMPDQTTVFRWLRQHEDFRKQYACAREDQADNWGDEIVEISDHGAPDDTQRARLMVDARKWLMSKAAPKKYGDKIDHTLAGPDGGAVQIERIERVIVDPQNSNPTGL
jgi:hypothetical protein